MFHLLSDSIDKLIDESRDIIKEEKRQYEIYDMIINYVKKHDLFISNIDFLISDEDEIEYSGAMQIYCKNPLKHANNLANEIYSLSKFVSLRTNIDYKEFSIWNDSIEVAKLYAYPNVHKYKKSGILLLPPEVELIEVYHKLYNIEYEDKWPSLLEKEEKLFSLYTTDSTFDHTTLDSPLHMDDLIIINSLFNKPSNYFQFFLPSTKFFTFENILKKKYNKIKKSKKKYINIPGDFRLNKITFYVDDFSIDVFNSTSYEIIPISDTLNPIISLRFSFISLILFSQKSSKLEKIKNQILYLRSAFLSQSTKYETYYDFIDSTNIKYVGVYKNENIAKKKLMRKSEFRVYVPAIYEIKKNKLREIG